MTGRINRCSHCGCDEPIHNDIDGKLYCNNCGMSLEKLEGGLTMETELLLQAAKEIKEICDNADGCDECPFSYDVGRYDVSCKFTDVYWCHPSSWNLDGNSK